MKRFIIFTLAIWFCLIQLCIGAPSKITKATWVINQYFPPYTYLDKEGIPRGFDVDIMEAIFKQQKIELDIHGMTWADAQEVVASGSADILSSIDRTKERQALYEYTSSPYITDQVFLFVQKESKFKKNDDLRGKKISIQRGVNYLECIKKIPGAKPVFYKTEENAILAVVLGEVDATIGTERVVNLYLESRGYSRYIRRMPLAMMESVMYFAVTKDNNALLEEVNIGYMKIVNNGVFQKIYKKWF